MKIQPLSLKKTLVMLGCPRKLVNGLYYGLYMGYNRLTNTHFLVSSNILVVVISIG